MKKVSIAVIGGAAMAIASLAQAADLPRHYAAPSVYDPTPTAYSWTGFYLGGTAGASWGGYNGSGTTYFGRNPGGGAFGLTGGYNYQSGKLLVGGEGDYAFTHIGSEATPFVNTTSSGVVQSLMTIRARVGFAADRLLVYGTGGYAGGNIRGVLNSPSLAADQTRFANGWTLGVGAEYAVTPHFSIKGEYLYASLGTNSYFASPNHTSAGANINTLRGGVNYHF